MYTDRENMAAIEQAVTSTAVSTDGIYVGDQDWSRSPYARAFAQVTESATASGSATVNIELIQADNAALTTNVEVLAQTGAVGKATLVDGYRAMDIGMPSVSKDYIGFRFTVATGPLTAGKFTAGFVPTTGSPISTRPAGFTGL